MELGVSLEALFLQYCNGCMEALRVIDGDMNLGFVTIKGIPGMRMVVFSILLMVIILFFRRGLMGRNEFSWEWFLRVIKTGKIRKQKETA